MYYHVIDFLEHNNILYDFQFGFRKHHSTNHAIITMVEKVSNALNTGNIVVSVFLDYRYTEGVWASQVGQFYVCHLRYRYTMYDFLSSYVYGCASVVHHLRYYIVHSSPLPSSHQ